MSNPVTEQLTDWLNDAPSADSNLPNSSSNAAIGSSQDLSGNLRLLKSVIRDEGINKAWERWKGLKNLADSADVAFTYISATQFSVNDDFTNTNRNVAQIGRRVKAILSGSTIYGTIVAAAFTSITTITVTWDSGTSLDATVSEVQFGPEPRAYDFVFKLQINRTGLTLTPGAIVTLDPSNDSSVKLVAGGTTIFPILVALDVIPNGAFGRFATSGIISFLNVNGATARNHYLVSAAASNINSQDSGIAAGFQPPSGAFAISLGTTSGAGTVPALLLGSTFPGNPAHEATHLSGGTDAISGLTDSRVRFFKENNGAGADLFLGSLPDNYFLYRSGTAIIGVNQIPNAFLKTATGSSSFSGVTDADVALNDYSFFPSFTSSGADRTEHFAFYDSGDPSDTVGRIHLTINAGLTHIIRWRYVTASDNPTIWAAYDEKTGAIRAVWASDDPLKDDAPALSIPGCTVKKFVAQDLGGLDFSEDELSKADAMISGKGLRNEHRLYRALQQKGELPSSWLLGNASIAKDGRLQMGKVHGANLPQAQSQRKTDKDILDDRVQKIMANNALPQALRDAFAQIAKLID